MQIIFRIQQSKNITSIFEINTFVSGKYKFRCPFCPKEVQGSSKGIRANMKRHIMIHTGEKPYKCEYCDFASNQKVSVERHTIKIHVMMK